MVIYTLVFITKGGKIYEKKNQKYIFFPENTVFLYVFLLQDKSMTDN